MNLLSTEWATGSGCCTVARVLGCIALLGVACNSLDEPRSNPTPSATEAPGSAPPALGQPAPNAAAPTASPSRGAAPGTSSKTDADPGSAAAGEGAPDGGGLEPPEEETTGVDAGTAAAAPSQPSTGEEPAEPEALDPTSDENLAFILEDGFETTYFAVHCSAIGEDGSEIDGDTVTELPVGGGYVLECNLDSLPSRATTDVLSAADEPWCALGELQSFETDGDERLDIVLVSPPDSPSPTLIATSDDPITLQLASAFGAPLWPVWLVTNYDAVAVARAEQGKLCDEVFGL
jgi:hypothetical protein